MSGKLLRVSLEEIKLPVCKGGLGLQCINRMSKSLILSQLLRLLKSEDVKSIGHVGFWLGELLGDLLPGIELGDHCITAGEYYNHLASSIAEAKLEDLVDEKNWRIVTNKMIYTGLDKNSRITKAETDAGGFNETHLV